MCVEFQTTCRKVFAPWCTRTRTLVKKCSHASRFRTGNHRRVIIHHRRRCFVFSATAAVCARECKSGAVVFNANPPAPPPLYGTKIHSDTRTRRQQATGKCQLTGRAPRSILLFRLVLCCTSHSILHTFLRFALGPVEKSTRQVIVR